MTKARAAIVERTELSPNDAVENDPKRPNRSYDEGVAATRRGAADRRGPERGDRCCRWIFPLTYFGLNALALTVAFLFF